MELGDLAILRAENYPVVDGMADALQLGCWASLLVSDCLTGECSTLRPQEAQPLGWSTRGLADPTSD